MSKDYQYSLLDYRLNSLTSLKWPQSLSLPSSALEPKKRNANGIKKSKQSELFGCMNIAFCDSMLSTFFLPG